MALAIRVRLGEAVTVGGLSIVAERVGASSLSLIVTDPDGARRRIQPPVQDLAPGVNIDAVLDERRVKMIIHAPREIPISRPHRTTFGRV